MGNRSQTSAPGQALDSSSSMGRLGSVLKKALKFVWSNLDAFLAIVVALGVVVAEVVGDPSIGVVDSAILILLGTVALALLRDRGSSRDLTAIRELADEAVSERPYIVVWQDTHWDLIDRDHVKVVGTEQLRFTRPEVSELFQWGIDSGTLEKVVAKWRRGRGGSWVAAEKIHEFPVRGGMKEIFSLNEEHNRGDMLDWCVEREILGQFPLSNESVQIEAATKSENPRALRITWPRGLKPTRVDIREGDRPARPLTPGMKNGRPYVEEKIFGLRIGETVKIEWSW